MEQFIVDSISCYCTMESSMLFAVTSLCKLHFFSMTEVTNWHCSCARKDIRLSYLCIGSYSSAAQFTSFNPTSTSSSISSRTFLTARWNSPCIGSQGVSMNVVSPQADNPVGLRPRDVSYLIRQLNSYIVCNLQRSISARRK